jgi:hypothetical protein
MRDDHYKDLYGTDQNRFRIDFAKRLAYARENGISTAILTGRNEPQQNREFLQMFAELNKDLKDPFRKIEMQTTGVTLDEDYLLWLRDTVGVTTISVSVSALDSAQNNAWNGTLKQNQVDLPYLTKMIVDLGFTLRMSLNLSNFYDEWTPKEIFQKVRDMGASQLTLRVFYQSSTPSPQNRWIAKHRIADAKVAEINSYIETNGSVLGVLEYGATNYSVDGLSVVLDDDCMNKKVKAHVQKYWILRDDGKLYSQWDNPASRVF